MLLRRVGPSGPRQGPGSGRKVKTIGLGDLQRKLGPPPVQPAGDVRPKDLLSEIGTPPDGRSIVLVLSSNPYQESLAGKRLSAFTDVLLGGIGFEQRKFIGPDGVLGFDLLQDQLRGRLETLGQTPVIRALGLPPGLSFMPGIFPDPVKPALRAKLGEVVEKLITAPPADRVADWTLDVEPSVPGPIPVGTRFALRVRARSSGYLIIFTVAPSGKVVVLYPNRFRKNNMITADRSDLFPYDKAMRIDPPAGREVYHVYWLETNPFEAVPVELYGEKEPMLVGAVEDLVRRLQREPGADAARVRGALVGGDAEWLRRRPGPRVGAWTGKTIVVSSVDR